MGTETNMYKKFLDGKWTSFVGMVNHKPESICIYLIHNSGGENLTKNLLVGILIKNQLPVHKKLRKQIGQFASQELGSISEKDEKEITASSADQLYNRIHNSIWSSSNHRLIQETTVAKEQFPNDTRFEVLLSALSDMCAEELSERNEQAARIYFGLDFNIVHEPRNGDCFYSGMCFDLHVTFYM